jgi:protein-arginine kinase
MDLNLLMIDAQPAALQRHAGRELAADERDAARADYIRTVLEKKG